MIGKELLGFFLVASVAIFLVPGPVVPDPTTAFTGKRRHQWFDYTRN